jgi:uncharacterized membrane protein (UPF0127 family)
MNLINQPRPVVILIAACIWLVASNVHGAKPAALLSGFKQAHAVIETSRDVCLLLDIYLADSPEEHAQGLMFVEQLDEFEGMLFRYRQPASMTMWMKNTYLPLDMLFLRSDGTIAGIVKATTPLSTKRINSPEAVPYVLELNAEFTNRWKIEDGNRLLSVE